MDINKGECSESLTDVVSGTRNILSSIEECLNECEGMPQGAQTKPPEPEGLNSLTHECREQAERLHKRVTALVNLLGRL
jgi:hypothetical protein